MSPKEKPKLEDRVIQAAEAALTDHQYASVVDVLGSIGWLPYSTEQAWRHGRTEYLEQPIQTSPQRIAAAIAAFQRWALANGLRPSETRYTRAAREGTVELRFTASGDAELEKVYRTHYVSAAMPERKRQGLEKKLAQAPQPVVFQILRDSKCSECGTDIEKDDLLFMEAGQPLCLACAGMSHLEYLPSGDAALTRRAGKYSSRAPVVVRFSRTRGRYERQGILVETEALAKAEQDCVDDAEDRARARQRGAEARAREDAALVERMAGQIQALFPGCPPEEARKIAEYTAERGSGRVGRSAAGRALDEEALTLAVRAAVRHNQTSYDEMLARGVDRESARARVRDRVEEILDAWREQ